MGSVWGGAWTHEQERTASDRRRRRFVGREVDHTWESVMREERFAISLEEQRQRVVGGDIVSLDGEYDALWGRMAKFTMRFVNGKTRAWQYKLESGAVDPVHVKTRDDDKDDRGEWKLVDCSIVDCSIGKGA